MKQNNVSVAGLTQYAVDNFLRWNLLAVGLPPVVWVNLLAHNQVTHFLRDRQLRDSDAYSG